jgi:F-type H+-transporting ATPase subunit a
MKLASRTRIATGTLALATALAAGPGAAIARAIPKCAPDPSSPKCPHPMDEFAPHPVIGGHLKLGAFDFAITQVVVYMWIAAAICILWTVWMARRMQLKPNGKQTFTELIYEFAENTIARATLGKMYGRYMPLVACLFMFLWVANIISFLPLPFGHEKVGGIPAFGLYAAASNINVTLALALVVFVLTHFEGIRNNGPGKYFASWAPSGVNFGLKAFIWPLHALSELLRLVSLSVRLFANMLAGHLLILMMLSLIIIIPATLGSPAAGVVGVVGALFLVLGWMMFRKGKQGLGGLYTVIGLLWVVVVVLGLATGGVPAVGLGSPLIALFFFLFEFGLVASLQAFIFAMLSGIYIGSAAEPHH